MKYILSRAAAIFAGMTASCFLLFAVLTVEGTKQDLSLSQLRQNAVLALACGAGITLMAAPILGLRCRNRRLHVRAIAQAASLARLQYLGKVRIPEITARWAFPIVHPEEDSTVDIEMCGVVANQHAFVISYSYTASAIDCRQKPGLLRLLRKVRARGADRFERSFLAVHFTEPLFNVPDFLLTPRRYQPECSFIRAHFGDYAVELTTAPALRLPFEKTYYLVAADIAAAQVLFCNELVHFFADQSDWFVQVAAGRLTAWRDPFERNFTSTYPMRPEKIAETIYLASELRKMLLCYDGY